MQATLDSDCSLHVVHPNVGCQMHGSRATVHWSPLQWAGHIVVEVDSTLVLCLLSPHSRMVSSMTILQHISSVLSLDWFVKFVHFFREANVMTNSRSTLFD
ncbi:hypothetical protein V6N12_014336 [Hibiscus sabdariffa]|uniref:RNase H type-1 domain-containing protein n=1 Tax=Hibiscus sabdariffa TaxID=183260 RepID=A0ABR2DJW0_9ROSI